MADFKVLYQHLPRGIEENNERHIRIAIEPAEIRTEHLQNTKRMCELSYKVMFHIRFMTQNFSENSRDLEERIETFLSKSIV